MDRSSTARPFWRVCIVRTCRQQSYPSASTILLMRSIVRVLLNSLLGPRSLVANYCNASTAAASHPAPPLRKIQSQQQCSLRKNVSLCSHPCSSSSRRAEQAVDKQQPKIPLGQGSWLRGCIVISFVKKQRRHTKQPPTQ